MYSIDEKAFEAVMSIPLYGSPSPDVIRGIIARYEAAKSAVTTPMSGDVIEAIKALAPFEVVQGDAIHRTNPTSKQVVNSSCVWAVSGGGRSAHKIRKHIEVLNNVK